MSDLLERLQALIADGIKGLENAQAEIAKRDATIATLTRRVEELKEALEGTCWALDELANNLGPGDEMYEVRERARAALPTPPKGEDHG